MGNRELGPRYVGVDEGGTRRRPGADAAGVPAVVRRHGSVSVEVVASERADSPEVDSIGADHRARGSSPEVRPLKPPASEAPRARKQELEDVSGADVVSRGRVRLSPKEEGTQHLPVRDAGG